MRQDLLPTQSYDVPNATVADGTPGVFSREEVWGAVDRIRKSRAMSGCQRLEQLLNFVVDSTLKGESMHLKETTIGVAVFGRTPDYDPKVDTIVRSQAWRLRSKLKKYYASEGANDPMIIDIPTGHYVPVFHLREEAAIEEERKAQ